MRKWASGLLVIARLCLCLVYGCLYHVCIQDMCVYVTIAM